MVCTKHMGWVLSIPWAFGMSHLPAVGLERIRSWTTQRAALKHLVVSQADSQAMGTSLKAPWRNVWTYPGNLVVRHQRHRASTGSSAQLQSLSRATSERASRRFSITDLGSAGRSPGVFVKARRINGWLQ